MDQIHRLQYLTVTMAQTARDYLAIPSSSTHSPALAESALISAVQLDQLNLKFYSSLKVHTGLTWAALRMIHMFNLVKT